MKRRAHSHRRWGRNFSYSLNRTRKWHRHSLTLWSNPQSYRVTILGPVRGTHHTPLLHKGGKP